MKIEITPRDTMLVLLILIGMVFILGLNVALKTEVTFGDEGFHGGWIRWIANHLEYPQWDQLGYTNVFKISYSRPPLFHLVGAGFMLMLAKLEIAIKILPSLISALIGISLYLLVKRLYNKELGLIAALILIGLPSFVTYSVLVFDETLFVLNMMLFMFTFLLAMKEKRKKYWILSAVFAGLTVLTKNAGLLVFPFAGLAFLYMALKEKKLREHFKLFAAFFIIVLLISGPYFLRNLMFFNTPTCYPVPLLPFSSSGCEIKGFEEVRQFEVRTFAGGSESSIWNFGLVNYITFTYGNFWFAIVGLVGGLFVLLKKSDNMTPYIMMILLLGTFVLLQTVQRVEDAARQSLAWTPFLALVSARYWNEIYGFLEKYFKYLGLVVIVLIVFLGYQSISSKLPGMEAVKRFSPLFFESCDWVKSNLDENVKIMTFWGYRAAYSCDRIISPGWPDIRLNDNAKDIVNVAEMHGITHFFIQKFSITQQPSRESYSAAFVELLENNPDKFEKVYENGLPLEQCAQQGGCDGNIIYKVNY